MKNAWTNGIMGIIVGDALGNPVQFMSRGKVMQRGLVRGMEAGGVFHMPAGCWTDDGSMTLATMDSLLKAINLGDDADTVGAVAGGLAGLYFGYEAVPEDWKKALKKRESLEEFCLRADQAFPM